MEKENVTIEITEDGVLNKVTGQQYKKGERIKADSWSGHSWSIWNGEGLPCYLIPDIWAKEV